MFNYKDAGADPSGISKGGGGGGKWAQLLIRTLVSKWGRVQEGVCPPMQSVEALNIAIKCIMRVI